jgi:hypothetical protein
MGVVQILTTLVNKGRKKLKTLITVPSNNFQSYNAVLNSNDELEITGTDGNGVAFQQTLPVQPGSVIMFDVSNHSFYAYKVEGDVNPNMQTVSFIRDIA